MDHNGKKKVLLLTNKFPYGIVETFIEAEMESLPEDVALTIIPIQIRNAKAAKRTVPQGVQVDVILEGHSKAEYLWKSFKMLFSKPYRDEVNSRKQRGRVAFQERLRLAGYFGRARQLAVAVERKYGDALRSGSTVLYSYWLATGALAESFLKEKTGCRTYARAHGTDVYDGQSVYGTIPGQEQAIRGLDRVFVCSRFGMRYLQEKYPALKKKISYAHLGTIDYGCAPMERQDDRFTVVSCSRLTPVKRVYKIAEALALVKDSPIRWVHIGDGPERERVEAAIKGLPDNIQVELLGNLPHAQVMEYYRKKPADVFVNVSSSEGLPVSIMEAVSFGIPVIATNVGGTGEVVNAACGTLLPAEFQAEELADTVKRYLLMTPEDYRRVREENRCFWEHTFSAARNYKQFYLSL